MPLIINTNIQSYFAQRALSTNTNNLQKTIEKLSTGYRINRASDDAAGLSISQKMTSEIRGLNQARRNAMDGISMSQTAEGALSIVQDNLQRIRELFTQGLSDTNGPKEKDALQREINATIQTIVDIAASAKFNGQPLLNGTANAVLQTGSSAGETTTISLQSGVAANTGININVSYIPVGGIPDGGHLNEGTTITLNGFGLTAVGMVVMSRAGTPGVGNLTDIDTMIGNVSRMRSELGAIQNSLESKISYLALASENATASRSRILDSDMAEESSNFIKSQILQQSAAAMLKQANQAPTMALSLMPT